MTLTKKERNELITNLKKRIKLLVNCCSTVRTLNNVYVLHGDYGIVLELFQLKGSWDIDRRPNIGGEVIKYLNHKSFTLITETKKELEISLLNDNDLFTINMYFEMMIKL